MKVLSVWFLWVVVLGLNITEACEQFKTCAECFRHIRTCSMVKIRNYHRYTCMEKKLMPRYQIQNTVRSCSEPAILSQDSSTIQPFVPAVKDDYAERLAYSRYLKELYANRTITARPVTTTSTEKPTTNRNQDWSYVWNGWEQRWERVNTKDRLETTTINTPSVRDSDLEVERPSITQDTTTPRTWDIQIIGIGMNRTVSNQNVSEKFVESKERKTIAAGRFENGEYPLLVFALIFMMIYHVFCVTRVHNKIKEQNKKALENPNLSRHRLASFNYV